jgi:hypothetical protein
MRWVIYPNHPVLLHKRSRYDCCLRPRIVRMDNQYSSCSTSLSLSPLQNSAEYVVHVIAGVEFAPIWRRSIKWDPLGSRQLWASTVLTGQSDALSLELFHPLEAISIHELEYSRTIARPVSRCRVIPSRVGLGVLSTKTGNFSHVQPFGYLTTDAEPIEDDAL